MFLIKLNRVALTKLRKFKNSLNNIILFLVYGDIITIGNNYQGLGVNYELNPHNAKLCIRNNVQIRKNTVFRIGREGKVVINDGVFINAGCSINALSNIEIGKNTIIGENVKIYDHNHGYKLKDIPIKEQPYTVDSITIGENCWIGSNVIILKGVEIGHNVIIGANTLIHKDILENSIVYNKQDLGFKIN